MCHCVMCHFKVMQLTFNAVHYYYKVTINYYPRIVDVNAALNIM